MKERELRKRCRRLLRDFDIRPPLDVGELCTAFGRYRSRPIRLASHPLPMPGPFGVWIRGKHSDYIFFQAETSPAHQDHIILHELGHILAGHHSDEQDDSLIREIYPDIEPERVRWLLRRTHYDSHHEQEAETVATIILEWASVVDNAAAQTAPPAGTERFDAALGERIGWL